MNRKHRILAAVTVLTVLAIWGQSLMSRDASTAESSWVLIKVNALFNIIFGSSAATEHAVRKTAHFTEYFILGLEYAGLQWQDFSWKQAGIAANGALVTAFLDESIQLVSGRSAEVRDVWIDFAGAAAGIALMAAFHGIPGKREYY